jgi:hypothetical protein
MMVNDAPENQGMNPQRVHPNNAEIAPNTAAITIFRVRFEAILTLLGDHKSTQQRSR